MASSRRNSNGRSSIVNQQRQITAFFTKSTSSPSPIIPSQNSNKLSFKHTPDQIPNANLSRNPSSNTPDPFQTKIKKPLLEIGAFTPSPSVTPDKSCGEEAVGRRIKVYWPLDKRWYEGVVKSCDKNGSKHLVQYDDGDEEMLDLGKEKFEWVEESVKRFKRLRLDSLSSLRKMVIDDEEAKELEDEDESNDGGGDVDDSTDEDWKNVAKEVREDCEEDEEDTELDSEEGDEENGKVKLKANQGQKEELRKRKMNGGGKVGSSAKKTKSSGDVNNASFKVATVETTTNAERKRLVF